MPERISIFPRKENRPRNGTPAARPACPPYFSNRDSINTKVFGKGGMGFGEGREKLFFRKVFPPFPNLPSHFQNNLRHADETADAARPPASAAPVLGNRRLAVRRGNRHGTFSGSGFNGLRPVCMGGQPDAPPSLLPAGGCVRHRRLVDRRKVRSPRTFRPSTRS